MRRPCVIATLLLCVAVFCLLSSSVSTRSQSTSANETKNASCPSDDAGLTLPAGFCATVFADGIGHARHMVVGPTGVVYVNTWSGEYYPGHVTPTGGFLVALQDTAGAGKVPGFRLGGASAHQNQIRIGGLRHGRNYGDGSGGTGAPGLS